MYTRKLIDFFLARNTPQTEPLQKVGPSPEAEFDWPPSAQDLDALSIVQIRSEDGSDLAPLVVADVA